jgi:hypothetical protein
MYIHLKSALIRRCKPVNEAFREAAVSLWYDRLIARGKSKYKQLTFVNNLRTFFSIIPKTLLKNKGSLFRSPRFFFQLTYASIVWIKLSRVSSQLFTFHQRKYVAPLPKKDYKPGCLK